MSTMGRGVWILDNVSALHQLAQRIRTAPAALLEPRTAHRIRYDVMTGPADPRFISPGAVLDYALSADAAEPLRLENSRWSRVDSSHVHERPASGD